MFLAEMNNNAQVEWGTPTFAGENTAVATIKSRTGEVTVEFDERGDGKVELVIVSDGKVNYDNLDGIVQAVRDYKSQHPDVQLSVADDSVNGKFVGRYLNGAI